MLRKDGRRPDQLRPIEFVVDYTKWAEGSVLAKFGDTHVLCNVTIEDRVPRWLYQSPANHGWLTAEYALLPRSTAERNQREQKWPRGRTQEISRLIGRALRMAVDLDALGQRQLIVDCDVLQADGGTRTAAISGAWIAVHRALSRLIDKGDLPTQVIRQQIAAVSVGVVKGQPLLDLTYPEDAQADCDINVVMTAGGELIEVQATAERAPLPYARFAPLLDLAARGIEDLCMMQEVAAL